MGITADLHYRGPKLAVMGVLELVVNTCFVVVHRLASQRTQHILSMATIRMAASSSQGVYFTSLGFAAYPKRSKT
jgi:hypothetical protein